MKQRPRIYYSETQKNLMWERWQQGDSLHDIARLFDRGHSSIQRILVETGGIRPATRRRSRLALSLAEREEISRGVTAGRSMRSIAISLGRAPSTISREIGRNGGQKGYRASKAEQAAWDRARRPKRCKLVENRGLRRIVAEAGPMLLAFFIGVAGAALGAVLGFYLLPLGAEAVQLAGVFTATYTGGSMNFVAVAKAVGFDGSSQYAAAMAADNLVGTPYLLVLVMIPAFAWVRRHFPSPIIEQAQSERLAHPVGASPGSTDGGLFRRAR